jgi:hemerythrin-like domain-containing protein
MSEKKRPDAAAELVQIHGMITQALNGALDRTQHFAQAGFPDAETQQALVSYMGCFGGLLHAHHVSEDEFVFPYIRSAWPDGPIDTLIAQHQEMEPLLADIRATCGTLSGNGHGSEASQALHDTLTRLSALWHPHIELEEAQFSREALDTRWDIQQEAKFGKALGEYLRQHTDPEMMQQCQAILFAER